VDEAWNASRAWAFLDTGRAFGTLDAGVFERYEGYWTLFPWLGTAIHAFFAGLFGPSLFSVRLASMLFGLLLVAAVYTIACRLVSKRTGLAAAILVSLSYSFFYSSHLARHDIVVAALGYGALALYLLEGDGRMLPIRSALAGLAIGLTLDVHFNGLVFSPAVLGLFVVDYGWKAVLNRRFWAFVAGAGAGVVVYAFMHLIPYPQTYFELASLANGSRLTPPIMSGDPLLLLRSLLDTIIVFSAPLGLLAVVACVTLAKEQSLESKKLLVIVSLLVVTFASLVRNKMGWYAIIIVPALCLPVAAYLEKLARERLQGIRVHSLLATRYSLPAAVRLGLVVGALVAFLLPSVAALGEDSSQAYRLASERVKESVTPGSSIIGSQTYWFAVPDHRYLSWDQLVYYQRTVPGSTLEDAFGALRPDYFIADGWLDLFITDDPSRLAGVSDNLLLPKSELNAFLKERAELVASVNTTEFGNVRIYRIAWN
jgi:4-amino-4-deoxy-L-arabinose transferase-like glycosyltransferase